ncbi:MAG: protein phosphatase 2C domain-containing protein [Halioglobus sp.]
MTPYGASTHQGLVRDHNEDCFEANPELGLWLVADGVGGHSHGEVASAIARDTIRENVAAGADLVSAIKKAHRAVLDEIDKEDHGSNMGSTVVALLLNGEDYEISWVGDSRAYLYDGAVRQLTRDHNPVSELLAAGILTREEAATHPDRHVLTQSLGVSRSVDLNPGRISGKLGAGQQIILCSDGLSDEVSTVAMAGHMKKNHTTRAQVDILLNAALEGGGRDNVTVVVVGTPAATISAKDGQTDRPDLQTTQEVPTIGAATAPVNHNGKILLLAAAMLALAVWWLF